jgi:hypothetical protein
MKSFLIKTFKKLNWKVEEERMRWRQESGKNMSDENV